MWEYRVRQTNDVKKLQEHLNKDGFDGWELVTCYMNSEPVNGTHELISRYVLKRRMRTEEKAPAVEI